jgi:CRP-like cAMP-binding protein
VTVPDIASRLSRSVLRQGAVNAPDRRWRNSASYGQHPTPQFQLLTSQLLSTDEELTHEFLAMMLATARPTVSLVARTLQAAGLIDYKYGHLTIRDRQGLEASACQCYAFTRELYAKLGR